MFLELRPGLGLVELPERLDVADLLILFLLGRVNQPLLAAVELLASQIVVFRGFPAYRNCLIDNRGRKSRPSTTLNGESRSGTTLTAESRPCDTPNAQSRPRTVPVLGCSHSNAKPPLQEQSKAAGRGSRRGAVLLARKAGGDHLFQRGRAGGPVFRDEHSDMHG